MPGHSQAHLDALARQMGFRDYNTYSAYQQQQAMMRGPAPTGIANPDGAGAAPGQAPPANWLQTLINKYTPLGYVNKRLQDVLPGQ